MSIVPEEAEIVKFIFKKYLEGIGAKTIARELNEMGIKAPKSDRWHDSGVRGIIKNEKYKGDVLQGKTFTIDPISHKRLKKLW